jgi:bifunctional non-homologous end joining protein LigD
MPSNPATCRSGWRAPSYAAGGPSTRAGTGTGAGAKEQWLLVKRHDDHADPATDITAAAPASVLTGRTLADLSPPGPVPPPPAAGPALVEVPPATGSWQAPMLASPADPTDMSRAPGEWTYERKLDGLRCIAVRDGAEVTLWSRNHLPFTARFPHVVAALRRVAAGSFVVDGELVVLDAEGSSFSALQRPDGAARAVLCSFDLLFLLGRDTTKLPLEDRRALLGRALDGVESSAVRVVTAVGGDAVALLDDACRQGWEGLVAKRAATPYRAGRSPQWRKLKCSASQEFVVGGWSDPTGARTGFGALLVGYRDGPHLRYAGRVGTGYDERELRDLVAVLRPLEVPTPPFADAGHQTAVHWVRPEVVVQVRFTEWTRDGRLRHPSYLGLRIDKDPASVVREDSGPSPVRRAGRPDDSL